MKIAGFGSIISSTYTDKMNVYRHEKSSVADDGTTGIKLKPTLQASNVKCRISFDSKDYPQSDLEASNPINMQIKIFCGPSVDIQKGDRLIVDRLDESGNIIKSYSGIANLPFNFVTHQEVGIVEVGDA